MGQQFVAFNAPGPQGPPGSQGLQGPAGPPGPGVTALTAMTVSGTVTAGQAVVLYAGGLQVATTANLAAAQTHAGIAITSGGTVQYVFEGPVSSNVLSLGVGVASAVGTDAFGNPCRMSSTACMSGYKILGFCDTSGAITVGPFRDDKINAIFFGFDPTNTLDCSPVWPLLVTFVENNIYCNDLFFPPGRYKHESSVTLAGGQSLRIRGAGISNQLNPNVYKGGSQLLAYGGGTFLHWGSSTANNESGGFLLEDLEILGQLNTGWSATPSSFNQIGLELLGLVGVTVRRCRFGSFQYQISVDGAEGTHLDEVQFDGGGDGQGYQDASTNLDGANKLAITTATSGSPIAVGFSGCALYGYRHYSGCDFWHWTKWHQWNLDLY